MPIKKVLIAHQSTIPHYRIPFYNTLENLRPPDWCFEIVFDKEEFNSPIFFNDKLDPLAIKFPIHDVDTIQFPIFNKNLTYQSFLLQALKSDMVIVENAVYNITYPLSHISQFTDTKIIYWGHGKDRHLINEPSPIKRLSERFKIQLVRMSDGFFAYTPGVKFDLIQKGIPENKIFVLNNTIDIIKQRKNFIDRSSQKLTIREKLGIEDENVLLFVGRFTPNKRISFLFNAVSHLQELSKYTLLLVGDGEGFKKEIIEELSPIKYLGPIRDDKDLSQVYIASDIFVIPGAVGLGPIQALCYDLPVITIDSKNHGPEIDYLSAANSVILDESTSPQMYAKAIHEFLRDQERFNSMKDKAWSSIQHLTVEQMANNFIDGVNSVFNS